jgi:hypothetical protein
MVDERRPVRAFHVKQFLSRHATGTWRRLSGSLIFLHWQMRTAHGAAFMLVEGRMLGIEHA